MSQKQKTTPDRRDRGTVAQRERRGAEAAASAPIEALGAWTPREDSAPVLALLAEQSAARVPELVPLRYERMGVSPFTFYRGSAIIMARDLSTMPVSGIEVQCIGDAHVANFGIFASPTRHLVFDVNDFDETAPGPWEWDVLRLAASLEVCGRDRGLSKRERRDVVEACARQYRRSMRRFSRMGELDVWYAHLDVERAVDELVSELSGKTTRTLRRAVEKARGKDSLRAADRLAHRSGDFLLFDSRPPELVPVSELADTQGYATPDDLFASLEGLLSAYFESLPYDRRVLLNRYRLSDAARKVVGVGSVGTRAWVALLTGKDADDPLVLQAKEATESVVERFWQPAPFAHHGERVVQGQRLVQSTADVLLGWTNVTAPDGARRDYYVRQLWNGKGSIDLEQIGPGSLEGVARLCAHALAHVHARTGDEVAIASYLDDGDAFADALVGFSRAYADQNERDYEAFLAWRDGDRD